MTRISAGIRGFELCDQHLLKERIEILRIPNTIKSGKARLDLPIPQKFKLGAGHTKFFYNKIKYLHSRYVELTYECLNRGFVITDYSGAFKDIPVHLYNDWEETEQARIISAERVNERMKSMSLKKPLRLNRQKVDYKDLEIH